MTLPAGATLLADARVTPAITRFALEVLHSSAEMGAVVPRVIDGLSLLAHVEPHVWTFVNGKRIDCNPPIRGVTIYVAAGVPSTLPPPPALEELVDVSHYQGHVDWTAYAASGHRSAICKATEHLRLVDDQFAANWRGMKAAGLARGAYHFFHPELDAINQAGFFLATIGGDLDPGDVLVLDVERLGFGHKDLAEGARDFCLRILEATGRRPLIYTSPGFWDALPAGANRDSAAASADLWVAHWGVATPHIPQGWTSYVLHQYSATVRVPGVSGTCDGDRRAPA